MVFLPGDHVLDTNITVANVTSLTMCGKYSLGNRATIVCDRPVGFSFTSMVDLKIDSLAFTSCGRECVHIHSAVFHVALHLQSAQYAELVNCSFHDNNGTALAVTNSNITLARNKFIQNRASASSSGGAIFAYNNTVLSFSGINKFINNSAGDHGGAIATSNSVLNFSGTNNFISNSAHYDGGAIITSNSVLNFSGINNFINNSVGFGGAISSYYNTVLRFSGINNFINNSADHGGGAIYAVYNTVLSFTGTNNLINNSAGNYGGGAIFSYYNTVLSFTGTNNLINNSAGNYGGGAIFSYYNTVLSFSGINKFINNIAPFGGAIYTLSNTTLTFNGTINFANNGNHGGGVDTQDGYTYGGGVYMGLKCTFSILPNTSVYWVNNHASFGGAIYVYDTIPVSYCDSIAPYVPKEECFFQLPGQNLSNDVDVQLVFKNNSADAAGSVLYGGVIDNCKLTGVDPVHSSGEVFKMLVHIEGDNTNSTISSVPIHICTCKNNFPDCSNHGRFPRTVYPGETFQVSVVAVGQRKGTVPSRVISTVENTGLLDSQYWLQQANETCTMLNYRVFSLSQRVKIKLHPEGSPCSTSNDNKLQVTVTLSQTCPPGFNISESARACVCEPRLAQYTNKCNITNGLGQITRDSGEQFWVGYDNQSDGLILHPLCPFDYCVPHTVVITLNNTDIQCAHNRSGLLCGRCKKGYSLLLGTSHCEQCTDSHLALLIAFAVMGVALVFLLLVCKLTMATGTLSGLVFYANIVGINHTIFLPVESTNPFSVFIACMG